MAFIMTTGQATATAKALAAAAVDKLVSEQSANADFWCYFHMGSLDTRSQDEVVSYDRVVAALQDIASDLRA